MARLSLDELAKRISAHLKNIPDLYMPYAYRGGAYVMVKYMAYWTPSSLRRAEAEEYLAALDSGRLIRHFTLKHEAEARSRLTP